MSGFKVRTLMMVLNEYFNEFHDAEATLEYVARQEFFLYSPTFLKKNEWVALIDDVKYIVWFDQSFYVRER